MISPHISYPEATYSQAAIRHGMPNIPDEEELANMRLVALHIFEPVHDHYSRVIPGFRLGVSSFFRNKFVNTLVKGSKNSQHMEGKAIDMDADIYGGISNSELFNYIKTNLDFDQLIWEYGNSINPAWVHASWNAEGNRHQILTVS